MTTSEPPIGYRTIQVEVSEREYDRLLRWKRTLTHTGTDSAALRLHMGLDERPRGIIAAEERRAKHRPHTATNLQENP